MPIGPDEIKSYSVSIANIDDAKSNTNIIVLKNDLAEMRRRSRPCVVRFHKVSKLKNPEEHLRLSKLYTPWRNENELKQDDKEVEDDILCNVQKHEPYLDIDYKVLQNFNIIESDDEEDATELLFSLTLI